MPSFRVVCFVYAKRNLVQRRAAGRFGRHQCWLSVEESEIGSEDARVQQRDGQEVPASPVLLERRAGAILVRWAINSSTRTKAVSTKARININNQKTRYVTERALVLPSSVVRARMFNSVKEWVLWSWTHKACGKETCQPHRIYGESKISMVSGKTGSTGSRADGKLRTDVAGLWRQKGRRRRCKR